MNRSHTSANPFALILDPQAVLASIAQSARLEGLQRRVYRPLDRPLLGSPSPHDEGDAAAYDETDDAIADVAADASGSDLNDEDLRA